MHQMSPPQQLRQQTSNCSSLLIYLPRKDEKLSWPSWLTYRYSGWLTHISGHPSATSQAQDSESTSAKDQCSTAGPRNQLDLGPGHIVLDGVPAPAKGAQQPPPLFGPCLLWPRSPISATAELLLTICMHEDP